MQTNRQLSSLHRTAQTGGFAGAAALAVVDVWTLPQFSIPPTHYTPSPIIAFDVLGVIRTTDSSLLLGSCVESVLVSFNKLIESAGTIVTTPKFETFCYKKISP